MRTRWLWTQKSALQSDADIDALIIDCDRCHVTDVLALSRNLPAHLVEQAGRQGIRVHVWWCPGHWPPGWVNAPEAWNTASLAGCDVNNLNFSLPEVQDALEAEARNICQNNTGIAGVHLDYIRYEPAMVQTLDSLSADDITNAVQRIRAVTDEFGLQLTVAGVQDYYASSWPAYNWCAEGVGQSPDEWIADGLVDYILMMHYYGPSQLKVILASYQNKPGEVRAKFVNGISPIAYMEQSQPLTDEQWRQLIELSQSYDYDLAVFDNWLLSEVYKQVLAEQLGDEMSVVEDLRTEATLLREAADRLDGIAAALATIDAQAQAAVAEAKEALAAAQVVDEAL